MKEEQKYNLKNSLFSLAMILSVIGVRIVDQYIYDVNIWTGLLFVVLLTLILTKIIDYLPRLDKEINKKTKMLVNISTLAAIFILFYTFAL